MNRFNSAERRNRLLQELQHAQAEFSGLERAAVEIIKEAPSGIPLPDSQFRIVQATQRTKLAFEKYRQAIEQYREFLKDGGEDDR